MQLGGLYHAFILQWASCIMSVMYEMIYIVVNETWKLLTSVRYDRAIWSKLVIMSGRKMRNKDGEKKRWIYMDIKQNQSFIRY